MSWAHCMSHTSLLSDFAMSPSLEDHREDGDVTVEVSSHEADLLGGSKHVAGDDQAVVTTCPGRVVTLAADHRWR